MLKSDIKAKKYIQDNKVFPIKRVRDIEMWCVEGESGVWNVHCNTVQNKYHCNCKNIRLTECSHIKAVRLARDKEMKNYDKKV